MDLYKYSDRLIKAGVPKEQAQTQIQVIAEMAENKFATKQDLEKVFQILGNEISILRTEMNSKTDNLRTDMNSLRVEMNLLRTEVNSKIDSLRLEMTSKIEALRAEMKSEIAALRAEMKLKFSELRTDFALLQKDQRHLEKQMTLIIRILIATLSGVIATLAKLLFF